MTAVEVNIRNDVDVPEVTGIPTAHKLIWAVGTDGSETLVKGPLTPESFPLTTTSFNGVLGVTTTTLQTAMDILDDAVALAQTAAGTTTSTANFGPILGASHTTVQDAIEALETAVEAFSVNAAGVAFTPTGNTTSVNVQAALEELQADIDAMGAAARISLDTTNFNGYLNAAHTNVQAALDTIDDLDASDVPVTPAGNLQSTTVQDALIEVQGHIDNAMAINIGFTPTAAINATNVQDAIQALTNAAIPSANVNTLTLSSAPTATAGSDGDYAIDISTGAYYGPKAAGAWPSSAIGNVFSTGATLTPDTGWSVISNAMADKVYDADAVSVSEMADVLATVVQGLLNAGVFLP